MDVQTSRFNSSLPTSMDCGTGHSSVVAKAKEGNTTAAVEIKKGIFIIFLKSGN